MRFLPAFASMLYVPVVFLTCRELGVSWYGAFLCASMALFDNLNVTEGRVLTTDTALLLFLALSFYFHIRTENSTVYSTKWFVNLSLTGLFMGMTVSTKWISLNVVGVVGIFTAFDILIRGKLGFSITRGFVPQDADFAEFFIRLFLLLGVPIMFYILNFYLWVITTPKWGEFGPLHMPTAFQAHLENSKVKYDGPPMPFWDVFVHMNTAMFTGNRDVGKGMKGHPWESWW
jgi:dolichyl-phosphate-mannose-protein mannosyltransferase